MLIVNIMEVLVLAKAHKNPISVPTSLFVINMTAKMTIFMAQPLFSLVLVYPFRNEGFLRIDVSRKSFKSVFF